MCIHRRLVPFVGILVIVTFSTCIVLADNFERCEDPVPILNATLVSHNGSLSVNFSWTFAPLQDENATFCHHMLSVRSFQSSAPYGLEDKMEPPHGGPRYTMLDQQAHHHIFDNINRVTYYQFELHIQSGLSTGNTKYYKHYSYLYYFGKQVPARVVEPVREHSIIRVRDGDPVTIPCEGAGTPSPTVLLLSEVNSQPPQACSGCPVDKGKNIVAVSEQDAGEYFCVAGNTLVNPPLGKRTVRDWKSIILIVEPVAEPPSNISQCLSYTHSTCGAFLDTDLLVFVDEGMSGDAGQLQLQEEVLSLFRRIDRRANRSEVSNLDPALRSKCHRLAQSIVCHSVYPYCDSNHQVPTPRLICKTTCNAFAAGGICEGFISEAETPELYARLAVKCDVREHPAGSNPECIPINLETAKIGHYNLIDLSQCAKGDGRNYAGSIRRVRSGLDCQSWSSQAPHKHPFWPSLYPVELISNVYACRNPGGVGEGPWCYTADPNVRWDYCEVPQCEVCQPYEGYGFCHGIEGYGDGNWTVYVDRSPSKWGPLGLVLIDQFLDGLLPRLTEDMGNETWSPRCDRAVRQLLCHATLPFCKEQEAAAPLMACNGCQLLDTIQFCSTIVYSRLLVEVRKQSSRFFFQPDDCQAAAAGSNISTSTGPDCMPPPGLPVTSSPMTTTALPVTSPAATTGVPVTSSPMTTTALPVTSPAATTVAAARTCHCPASQQSCRPDGKCQSLIGEDNFSCLVTRRYNRLSGEHIIIQQCIHDIIDYAIYCNGPKTGGLVFNHIGENGELDICCFTENCNTEDLLMELLANLTTPSPTAIPVTTSTPATLTTTALPPAGPVLTPPSEIEAHCSHVNWRNSPNISCEDITGYDVRLFNPDTGLGVTRRVDARATFHNFLLLDKELVEHKSTTVQIRIVSSSREGPYSSPVETGCFVPHPPSVYFELNGERYDNNSMVNIFAIGKGNSALLCKTNKQDCCGTVPNRLGEFYYPHGGQVSIYITGDGFYRNRGNQMIRLNRRDGISSPTGRYLCEIPDASDVTQKIFINISNDSE